MVPVHFWWARKEGKILDARDIGPTSMGRGVYEAPTLERLGSFHVETQTCFWGKQLGGHDTLAGIVGIEISSCSA